MKSIDISNQPKTAYKFADDVNLESDKTLAKTLLKKVYDHVSELISVQSKPGSVSFITNDNRRCRVIIYDFNKLLKNQNLFAVIFFGFKRENISEIDTANFFNTDWEIAMSMTGTTNILCYASQELHDGNWFNIVLFTNDSGKQEVKSKEKHNYAAYTLAPKRFSWVRLHNAVLKNGLVDNQNITYESTKYYEFDSMWFAKRMY